MKTQNDKAWEELFEKYNVLSHIEASGKFIISATKIKEYREPRLMAKFDHNINLPKVFSDNNLAILPISRGDYVISHFEAYHFFENGDRIINRVKIPSNIQSLDINNIASETVAINCALISGMLEDFLEDEELYATVSGRMGSGKFRFSIKDMRNDNLTEIKVNNSQIEIDAAFEGINSLALIEAKRDLAEDFLIRQLYYPFRVWNNRVTKKVRPVFLVHTNGIFSLYEYEFKDSDVYNSLKLVKQKNYSIEDTAIEITDLERIYSRTIVRNEPVIAFPQADNFERVINICELLNTQELSREQVTEEYAFDIRQTNYYTDAAIYLGLVEKSYEEKRKPIYSLTLKGKHIMSLSYKQRQIAFCEAIFEHQVFNEIFKFCMNKGFIPSKDKIVDIMKKSNLSNINSISTYNRRASTVSGWINWMLGLVD